VPKNQILAILLRSLKIFTNREGVRIDFLFFSIISIYINIYIFIYRIERERRKEKKKKLLRIFFLRISKYVYIY
jgi:hypothetical protein